MKEREQSVAFMSSTKQATSSTSIFQLIVDALADYTKITGIDLSKKPFAAALEQSSSPESQTLVAGPLYTRQHTLG